MVLSGPWLPASPSDRRRVGVRRRTPRGRRAPRSGAWRCTGSATGPGWRGSTWKAGRLPPGRCAPGASYARAPSATVGPRQAGPLAWWDVRRSPEGQAEDQLPGSSPGPTAASVEDGRTSGTGQFVQPRGARNVVRPLDGTGGHVVVGQRPGGVGRWSPDDRLVLSSEGPPNEQLRRRWSCAGDNDRTGAVAAGFDGHRTGGEGDRRHLPARRLLEPGRLAPRVAPTPLVASDPLPSQHWDRQKVMPSDQEVWFVSRRATNSAQPDGRRRARGRR